MANAASTMFESTPTFTSEVQASGSGTDSLQEALRRPEKG